MSALFGAVGGSEVLRQYACQSSLNSQVYYGRCDPHLSSFSGATFGCCNFPMLPGESAASPLAANMANCLLLADSRLDNRDALRARLGPGIPNGISDAELILQLWCRYGSEAWDLLAGPFAIALWDAASKELHLARDLTGQRPLFAASLDCITLFATTPKGMLGSGLLELEWDFPRLAATLSGDPPAGNGTCFRQVRRILPGHVVTVREGQWTTRRFWNGGQSDCLRLSDAEFAEEYQTVLRDAVGAQLRRSHGRAGSYLSSGYDSSAVAATAATLQSDPLLAITAAPTPGFTGFVPRGRFADESLLAAKTARLHRMEHVVVRTQGSALQLLRRHSHLYQDPFRNVANMDWFSALGREARDRGATVLFDAQMGNLSLHATGLPVLREWLVAGDWAKWAREASAAWRHSDARLRGILYNSFGTNMPSAAQNKLMRLFAIRPSAEVERFARPEWLGRADSRTAEPIAAAVLPCTYRHRRESILDVDMGLVRKGALAEWGVDERDPTADRRVIDFSLQLPPEQLLRGGRWRPLARRALDGLLPPEVLDLHERGYQGADWAEHFNLDEAQAIVDEISTSPAVMALFDLHKLRRVTAAEPREHHGPVADLLYRNRFLSALALAVFMQEIEAFSAAVQASRSSWTHARRSSL